jgi:hypothetical protein
MANGDAGKKKLLLTHRIRGAATMQEVWQRQADMVPSFGHTGRRPSQVPICRPTTESPPPTTAAEAPPYLSRLAAQVKNAAKKTKKKQPKKTSTTKTKTKTTATTTTRRKKSSSPPPSSSKSARCGLWCWGKSKQVK